MSTTYGATHGGESTARETATGVQGVHRVVETLLRRLNDPEVQAQAYPVLDEFEHAIDLEGTDILHGWRYDLVPDSPDGPGGGDSSDSARGACFSDAFSNAFRVMVLGAEPLAWGLEFSGQPVLRRVGWSGTSWMWEHTGTVTRWVVEISGSRGGKYTRLSAAEKAFGENLFFDSGTAACEAVRHMLAMGGYGGRLGFRVRAVETGPEPANGPTSQESG